mmetsp:Transcript_22120/g.33755  ORF Transcript_22120/g.33755 Transcript_22120/m.33755 type:complete len:334 (+) Transcript_22120:1-1002(+)
MDTLVAPDAQERSKTSMLVKNLSFDTTIEELTKIFHGIQTPPSAILLPPSRTIALVQYDHQNDARTAFRKLAYKRFKNVPLYLEWAPMDVKKVETGKTTKVEIDPKPEPEKQEEEMMEEGVVALPTIYVKNLNFKTNEEVLQKAFEKVVTVRSVRIPTKAPAAESRTKSSQLRLSMGFGFVECDSMDSAKKALRDLQGTLIDGHKLELSLSKSSSSSSKKSSKISSNNTTKLMIRNIPFEATRKELQQLFGSVGQLKRVRLPKKFDGNHRGFAFVEYLTTQEAQEAMKTLSKTHLYGRHLVLEWADKDDDVNDLRRKASRDVAAPPNKKIKFD